MKKFIIFFIVMNMLIVSEIPVFSVTIRDGCPSKIINPDVYRRRYSAYRMVRGKTTRCKGNCHSSVSRKKRYERHVRSHKYPMSCVQEY